MDLLFILGASLTVGFAVGYCIRANLSRRNRRIARLYYPLPVPPFGRR
jgi:hypothetical protein